MTSTVSRTYPLPPLDLVEVMLSPEFQQARAARLGGIGTPTVTRHDGSATVRFPRRLPLDDLPGPLRALAGTGEVTQVEEWDVIGADRCTARWRSESKLPGTAGGTFEVLPDGAGSRYTVVATVEIKVPLVGGRIGKEAETQVVKLIGAEMDFAEEFLASR